MNGTKIRNAHPRSLAVIYMKTHRQSSEGITKDDPPLKDNPPLLFPARSAGKIFYLEKS